MDFVGRVFNEVSNFYKDLNPATLSGAIDVVVVERPDGTLMCSSFHVRFGKMQLLRPQEKGVEIKVNGKVFDFQMKVGEAGEAFFVVQTDMSENIPQEFRTSPLVGPSPVTDEMNDIEDLDLSVPKDPQTVKIPVQEFDEIQNSQHDKDKTILRADTVGPEVALEVDTDLPIESENRMSNFMTPKPQFNEHPKSDSEVDYGLTREVWNWGGLPSTAVLNEPVLPNTSNLPIPNTNEKRQPIYVKTLRLTSDQLKSLNLNYGPNNISFTVNTRLQGTAKCNARLFLWRYDVQVVVSDIDGTITKSDALGHLFTMVGKDWTHPGIANLYTNIKKNGYQFMYLTSRAIGQADSTRAYLTGVEQGSYQLPDGPVIMSPDRLIAALKRELIDRRPEEFKIAALKDVKNLFVSRNPFYAGFGNRITDALSYRAVSIPAFRIYTINPSGEIKMDFSGYRSSYIKLADLVDHIFPPIQPKAMFLNSSSTPSHEINYAGGTDTIKSNIQKTSDSIVINVTNSTFDLAVVEETFNDFNFWRPQLPLIPIPTNPIDSKKNTSKSSELSLSNNSPNGSKSEAPTKPRSSSFFTSSWISPSTKKAAPVSENMGHVPDVIVDAKTDVTSRSPSIHDAGSDPFSTPREEGTSSDEFTDEDLLSDEDEEIAITK